MDLNSRIEKSLVCLGRGDLSGHSIEPIYFLENIHIMQKPCSSSEKLAVSLAVHRRTKCCK